MNKKRVSEIITTDNIRSWEDGNIITITAGTGAGKSYFIKNILYAFAKLNNTKILFLIHRTNCTNQFYLELKRDNKLDIIDIKTYQSIENNEIDFKEYQYIICDEFHYFMSDASFNITTDISLNKILEQTNKIRIFMSATGDYVKRYIKNVKKLNIIDYEIPIDFNFINELKFFNHLETLENFIKECIERNEKAIFFIQSAKQAFELYNKYKDNCLFNCSKSNTKYYKYVDKDKINNMLINEQFEENILITTSCMDAGVNIIDDRLNHIICDIKDIGTLIQCIGRKRIQGDNDRLYVYIKSISNNQLGGMKTQLLKKIEKADFLKNHTVKEYILEYPRQNDYNNIVYDVALDKEDDKAEKKINELMYFKNIIDIALIDKMLSYEKGFGYNRHIAELFNKDYWRDVDLLEEKYKQNSLEDYLNSIAGEKLFKEEQKELIEIIGLKDGRGRLQKSISQLNEYFKANKLQYIIISKRIKKDNKLNTIWMVDNLIIK